MSTRFENIFGKFFNEYILSEFSNGKSVNELDHFAYAHSEEQLNKWVSLFPPPSIYEIYDKYLKFKKKSKLPEQFIIKMY